MSTCPEGGVYDLIGIKLANEVLEAVMTRHAGHRRTALIHFVHIVAAGAPFLT